MADFDVAVRGGYRDVGGLVLDCSAHDYDAVDGRVARWRNRAPEAPVGEPHGRLGDPALELPLDVSRRPEATRDGAVRFARSAQNVLIAPNVGGSGAVSRRWAFAFEYAVVSAVTADPQAVFGVNDSAALTAYRLYAGDAIVKTSGTTSGFAGDLAPKGRLSVFSYRRSPLTRYDWYVDGALAGGNLVIDPASAPADEPFALIVGASKFGEYLDGDLYSLRAWRKPLSPRERDLVFGDLSTTSYSVQTRCRVESVPWRDGTGSPSRRQVDRLRPGAGLTHTYRRATLPGGPGFVQFGCEQHDSGVALEDALLGGALYAVKVVERAGPVTVQQDSDWSSVFDVYLTTPGHYTLQFLRPGHGSKIVHLDVAR